MPGVFNASSPFGPGYRADVLKNTATFITGDLSFGTSTIVTGPCRVRGHVSLSGLSGEARWIFREGPTARFYLSRGVFGLPAEGPWNAGYTTNPVTSGTNGENVWIDIFLPAGWSIAAQDYSGTGVVRYYITVEAL